MDELDKRLAYKNVMQSLEKFGMSSQERQSMAKSEFEEIVFKIAAANFGEEKAAQLIAQAKTAKLEAKQQVQKTQPLQTEIVAKIANGFAAQFGCTFHQLPIFQQETIKALCALHLGYIPENFGMDPNKAVYLCGISQIGKTSVFRWVKENGAPFFAYRIVTAYALAEAMSKEGHGAIETYKNGKVLCIDEVGMEEQGKHYGVSSDVVAEIIHARYGKGLLTHMTSNFRVEDLPYGTHIKNRILQGCNVITARNVEPFIK